MLIPEKPIQIHAATPITPTTREHSTFANKKFNWTAGLRRWLDILGHI